MLSEYQCLRLRVKHGDGTSQIVTRTNYESLITVIITTIKIGSFAVQPQTRTSRKHENRHLTHQMSHHQDMTMLGYSYTLVA